MFTNIIAMIVIDDKGLRENIAVVLVLHYAFFWAEMNAVR